MSHHLLFVSYLVKTKTNYLQDAREEENIE